MDLGAVGPPKVVYQRSTEPTCPHSHAVKVTTVDGEHVGWLCPDCDGVLKPEWVSVEERNRR